MGSATETETTLQVVVCWVAAVSGTIPYIGSATERRRYNVTSSLIGWAHTPNDSCILDEIMESRADKKFYARSNTSVKSSLYQHSNEILYQYTALLLEHIYVNEGVWC